MDLEDKCLISSGEWSGIAYRTRWITISLGSYHLAGRGSLAKDWIGEHRNIIEFRQYCWMSEPGDTNRIIGRRFADTWHHQGHYCVQLSLRGHSAFVWREAQAEYATDRRWFIMRPWILKLAIGKDWWLQFKTFNNRFAWHTARFTVDWILVDRGAANTSIWGVQYRLT